MRVDGFYVVGRETPGDVVSFLRTFTAGGKLAGHWGELRFADRYLMFGDAEKAAKAVPRLHKDDGSAEVWRVEVTATKETTCSKKR